MFERTVIQKIRSKLTSINDVQLLMFFFSFCTGSMTDFCEKSDIVARAGGGKKKKKKRRHRYIYLYINYQENNKYNKN